MRTKKSMTQKWMILLMMKGKNKKKFLDTLRRFSVMIDLGKVFNVSLCFIAKSVQEQTFLIPLRYKDESDYALKFMESSWKDMQKEEARR